MTIGYSGGVESWEHGGVVVAARGEVDMFTTPDLKRDLHAALYSVTGDLVLDLSGLDFIDSSGLGVLIGVLRRLHEEDRRMALVIPQRNVRRIFTMTGLDKAFAIADSRTGAWDLIAASRLRHRPDHIY